MLDETLVTLAGPPTAYGGMTWSPASGTELIYASLILICIIQMVP